MKSKHICITHDSEEKKIFGKLSSKNKKIRLSDAQAAQAERKESAENGGFFKYAYRLYYLLDMPAEQAFKVFCEVMRTVDYDNVVKYLYKFGLSGREDILESFKNNSVEYREDISGKFKYINKRMKELCFRRLTE